MQPMVGIQLSVFGKTLRERFLQMTGWILQPCSVRSQVPRFQCLLVDGHTPEWCEGDALIPLGDCWTPSIGGEPALAQRRKRVFVVADFAGQRAGEVLFKPRTVLPFSAIGGPGGCPPPPEVEYLLLKQGGRYPSSDRFPFGGCELWHRSEIRKDSAPASDEEENHSQLCLRV